MNWLDQPYWIQGAVYLAVISGIFAIFDYTSFLAFLFSVLGGLIIGGVLGFILDLVFKKEKESRKTSKRKKSKA